MKSQHKLHKLPTIKRLPDYLAILRRLSAAGEIFVSSANLAEQMGILPILVRKDFELLKASGTRRIGYPIELLIRRIENYLGWGASLVAFLIGAGQLGSSILANRELSSLGLRIAAAFDNDPRKIKKSVHGVPVYENELVEELAKKMHVSLAILCVPSVTAQYVTDELVASGIRGIWNFTSAELSVPEGVVTQKVDFTPGFAVLSAKLTRLHMSASR